MRSRVALPFVSICFGAIVVDAPQARACEPIIHQTNTFDGASPFTQHIAPPGGVWFIADEAATDVVLEVRGQERDADVVTAGPHVLAVRVPDDVVAEEEVRVRSATREHVVSVAAGAVAAAPAPTLELRIRNEPIEAARNCEFGLHAVELTDVAVIEAVATSDGPALLVDTWILAPDAPLPDESASRMFDSVVPQQPLGFAVDPSVDFTMLFDELGTHDLHLRVRDSRTGLASSIETARVEIEPQSFGGCAFSNSAGCSASTPTDAPWIIAITAVALRLRRKQTA